MRLYRPTRGFATTHTKFCVIGGGSGGLNMASHLVKDLRAKGEVRMFEPSPLHYFLSGYIMIGADVFKSDIATRENSKIVSKDIHLTALAVKKVVGEKNTLITSNDDTYTYDHLIISTGVKNDWHKIKGAKEALDDPKSPVCCIYQLEYAEKCRKLGNEFKGGRAIFTEPQHPIRCSSAPQQIMYLLADKWANKKTKAEIQYFTANEHLFRVPVYNNELVRIAKEYGVDPKYKWVLVEVRKDDRVAVFKNEDGVLKEEKYDFLHLVPPSSAHSYIAESGLGDSAGYCDVTEHSMRHKKFNNIWSIGDASSMPCSKTAAALYTQTDVFIKNIKLVLQGGVPENTYDGYSSCPIYVGKNKAILAEYKYKDLPDMTFYGTQQKPSRLVYSLVKDFFPFAYWRYVPQGIWLGKSGVRSF